MKPESVHRTYDRAMVNDFGDASSSAPTDDEEVGLRWTPRGWVEPDPPETCPNGRHHHSAAAGWLARHRAVRSSYGTASTPCPNGRRFHHYSWIIAIIHETYAAFHLKNRQQHP